MVADYLRVWRHNVPKMKQVFRLLLGCVLLSPVLAMGQKDTLIKKLDSLHQKKDSAGGQINNIAPAAYNNTTNLDPRTYFILLTSDIKQAFSTPFHLDRKDGGNLLKFALLEGALSFADEPIQKNALDIKNNNPAVRSVSNYVPSFGGLYEVYTLVGMGTFGIIFKKDKMKTTTLLATQAYLTGGA